MRTNQEKRENILAEYSAIVKYHGLMVSSRFTIAGLYIAAIALVASKVVFEDIDWLVRALGSLLACWFTVCVWILELRSRSLYTNIAHRGIDIEHREFGLNGSFWYEGFFSRQYKEEVDRPKIAWMKKRLSARDSARITHSWGFDLLYGGSLAFWYITLIFSLVYPNHCLVVRMLCC